ncbi:hypothetical protein [uncultured Enterobacter sp.]|uniref:hypothetical protein n=1 Tax=uncultured Enterobacter sp. TaxID=238202 RepID=UPI002612D8A1|nr:hypothetical protein [uncultured Enterobacter sp.]
MNNIIDSLRDELKRTINELDTKIPSTQALNIAHNNWTFPGISKNELISQTQELIDIIDSSKYDEISEQQFELLNDYLPRLQRLNAITVPNIWSNGNQAIPAFQITLNSLAKALTTALDKNHSAAMRDLLKKVRTLEARIKDLEPRTNSLNTMVSRIEEAYNAADQLPTDLESLNEARIKIKDILQTATTEHAQIAILLEKSTDIEDHLKNKNDSAENILKRCESAYSAATTVGLAAAFIERSKSLSNSMWVWVTGLIISLGLGSYFGANRLHELLQSTSSPNPSIILISTNLILSILSIGAPVWFSWLATKQIGHRFKLSEDYAFKASVSRAYEGYRTEASRIDKNLEIKLLESALNRIDELPLRLVDTENHGSPFHELLSSEIIKEALKTVPGFVDRIKNTATESITTLTNIKNKQTANNDNLTEKDSA